MLPYRHPRSPLTGVPPFDRWSNRQLAPLTPELAVLTPKPGRVLLREGALAREFMAVLDGDVEIRRGDQPLGRVGAPATFGGSEIRSPRNRWSSTVVAGPDLTVVVINVRAAAWARATLPGWTELPDGHGMLEPSVRSDRRRPATTRSLGTATAQL